MTMFQVSNEARGGVPYDMMEVSSRQKDIQYSIRTRAVTDQVALGYASQSTFAVASRRLTSETAGSDG